MNINSCITYSTINNPPNHIPVKCMMFIFIIHIIKRLCLIMAYYSIIALNFLRCNRYYFHRIGDCRICPGSHVILNFKLDISRGGRTPPHYNCIPLIRMINRSSPMISPVVCSVADKRHGVEGIAVFTYLERESRAC